MSCKENVKFSDLKIISTKVVKIVDGVKHSIIRATVLADYDEVTVRAIFPHKRVKHSKVLNVIKESDSSSWYYEDTGEYVDYSIERLYRIKKLIERATSDEALEIIVTKKEDKCSKK